MKKLTFYWNRPWITVGWRGWYITICYRPTFWCIALDRPGRIEELIFWAPWVK